MTAVDSLLMIPGPTPLSPAVRAALAEPMRSHTSTENAASMRRIADGVRACVGSRSARVYTFAGSGTLAMEAALINHAAPGDRVVVCSHGFFGDRFSEIASAHGMHPATVQAPWGSAVRVSDVERACSESAAPAVLTITHVDTSTGVLADCAGLARIGRDAGAIVVVDGVCATGAVEELMDGWGVDVVLTGAQKALSVAPGLAVLAVSERAQHRRAQLDVHAYYADLQRWDPVVDDPTRYFSTHATGLLRALEVSLDEIAAEGLPARFARHRHVAETLRSGFAELGFESLAGTDVLAPTLSVLSVPSGVDEAALRRGLAERGVVVAGGLGPFAGRAIRVGHMGTVGDAEVSRTLEAASNALSDLT